MKMLGYSERGILNALLYEIRYAGNGDTLLAQLISRAAFPFTDDKPPSGATTILVEQSFSDFGDADAVILIKSNAGNCAIFVEAKVKGYGGLPKAFEKFGNGVKAGYMPRGFSSNIFTQIYHKQQIVKHGIEKLQQGVDFPNWSFTKKRQERRNTKRKIGKNKVVREATGKIKESCDSTFYLMLIPDADHRVEEFFNGTLRDAHLPDVPNWDCSRYGYLTWRQVEAFCEKNKLNDTLAVFGHNRGQIYAI